VTEIVVGYSK